MAYLQLTLYERFAIYQLSHMELSLDNTRTRPSCRSAALFASPHLPCALIIVVIEVTSVATSVRFDGTISVLPVFARLAKAAI